MIIFSLLFALMIRTHFLFKALSRVPNHVHEYNEVVSHPVFSVLQQSPFCSL